MKILGFPVVVDNNDPEIKKGKPILSLSISAKINVPKIKIPVNLCAIAEYARCDYQASEERTEYYLESFSYPKITRPRKK